MNLRHANAADVPALVDLSRASFTDAFGHLYDLCDLAAFLDVHRAPEKFAADIASPDASVMLAEEGDELIGYCVAFFGERFEGRPEPQPSNPCMLSQLYCAHEATGRGIGAAFMEAVIAEARERGCDAIQLSVYSENFGAQRFYERYGFTKVANIDFWVGNHRDDEFLLERRL